MLPEADDPLGARAESMSNSRSDAGGRGRWDDEAERGFEEEREAVGGDARGLRKLTLVVDRLQAELDAKDEVIVDHSQFQFYWL